MSGEVGDARKRLTPTETPTQRDARIWREGWEAKRHAHPTDMPVCPYDVPAPTTAQLAATLRATAQAEADERLAAGLRRWGR